MKYLKYLFLVPWMIWTWTWFWIYMIVLFPWVAIAVLSRNKNFIRWVHRIPSWIARATVFTAGIHLDIRNKQIIDRKKQYIFVSNHSSTLDIFLPGSVIPNYLKYLGKAEFLKYPGFGFALKHLYVPVKRKSEEDRKRSMEAMKAALAQGASLIIYPEGTRNRTGEIMKPFYTGAFRLSIESGVPIAVFTTVNAAKRWRPDTPWISPGTVKIFWEKVLSPEGRTMEDAEAYREEARDLILQRLVAESTTS